MSNINLLIQTKEKNCGHTCVAMLSGKSIDDIEKLIGHSKGTKTKEIVKVLNKLNIKNSQKLLRICSKRPLPKTAIIKGKYVDIKQSNNNWHWILKHKEEFFDPIGLDNINNLKITSFIEVSFNA